jgi:F-type H+-transporting ATPase subunit beta
MPKLLTAIEIRFNDRLLIAEVAQHIETSCALHCAVVNRRTGTRTKAVNTHKPIEVPVGPEVLGRLFNVTGHTIDNKGEINTKMKMPIHRPAPSFEEQDTSSVIFETGIKVIDLIAPYSRAEKSDFSAERA